MFSGKAIKPQIIEKTASKDKINPILNKKHGFKTKIIKPQQKSRFKGSAFLFKKKPAPPSKARIKALCAEGIKPETSA